MDDFNSKELMDKISALEINNHKLENRYAQILEKHNSHLSRISSLEGDLRSINILYT